MTPPDHWLNEALATRDMERVTANVAAAGQRINDARRHVRSARLLSNDDPTLAIAACHDAIRKAITAHMIAAGLRPHAVAKALTGSLWITPVTNCQTWSRSTT